MKIHFDLPWGGVLHIEKKPMDEFAKFCILSVGGFLAFLLSVIWILR